MIIFDCDNQSEWKPLHNIKPDNEIPVTSLEILNVPSGENLYTVGFANGSIKLINPKGQLIATVNAHSRGVNALTCHPVKSIFASCSDDTFMNIFKLNDKSEVTLVLSSRVNDYQLVGVAFSEDSVISTPYDFKNIAIWNSVV